jgi:hypothetical protein
MGFKLVFFYGIGHGFDDTVRFEASQQGEHQQRTGQDSHTFGDGGKRDNHAYLGDGEENDRIDCPNLGAFSGVGFNSG